MHFSSCVHVYSPFSRFYLEGLYWIQLAVFCQPFAQLVDVHSLFLAKLASSFDYLWWRRISTSTPVASWVCRRNRRHSSWPRCSRSTCTCCLTSGNRLVAAPCPPAVWGVFRWASQEHAYRSSVCPVPLPAACHRRSPQIGTSPAPGRYRTSRILCSQLSGPVHLWTCRNCTQRAVTGLRGKVEKLRGMIRKSLIPNTWPWRHPFLYRNLDAL